MLAAVTAVLTGPAMGADLRVVEAVLSTPSDSHEPQKARVVTRNDGSAVRDAAVACTFSDEAGRALEKVETPVRTLAAGAERRSEVIYYGWPRASRVSCDLAGGQ